MKKLLMTSLFVLSCVIGNAQLQPPVQTDTLIIESVRYNFADIYEENWPCTSIYKSTTSFTFGDEQFRIVEVEKGLMGDVYFTLVSSTPENNSDEYTLVYTESNNGIIVEFSGYEFLCSLCRPDIIHASFMGGGPNAFSQWVNSELQYPEKAKDEGIQGRVETRFTIGADGYVKNVEIVKSVEPSLDAEAIRVISSSPKWKPAMQGEKPVSITYDFPVIFQLR